MNSALLFNKLFNLRPLSWQAVLEDCRMMIGLFSRVQLLILDGLTKERCIASYLVAKQILALTRKSGALFVALYLKQCSASLQFYRGSLFTVPREMSTRVSLTGAGLPRIIPAFHRGIIQRRGPEADVLVKFYLSLFSIARIIPLAKKVSSSTFKSIVTPPKDLESILEVMSELKSCIHNLISRYLPSVARIPLRQGLVFEPTWKAIPTKRIVQSVLVNRLKIPWEEAKKVNSSFLALPYELASWRSLLEFTHAKADQFSQGALWPHRIRYALDPMNKLFAGTDLDIFERTIGPFLPSCGDLGIPPITGRLSCSFPGAGKRRIFAIGNYINQRLLRPVHDWAMDVLRSIPQDGAFNQTKPLKSLQGRMECFSYDLSAATDRWPLVTMFEIFQVLFDRSFASSVVNSALATNIFEVPFVKRKRSFVSFVAGQPLGYYSSWALFSLSHHFIVWLSAEKVYPGRRFTDYAILGDDVLIADPKVAPIYASYVERLGVSISLLKSIVSNTGCIEFAKKFLVNGLMSDLSPISVRTLMNYYHPYGPCALHLKYGIKSFKTFARIGGSGFRSLSTLRGDRPSSKSSKDLKRKHTIWQRYSGLPLNWWLGHGLPLNPYLIGIIKAKLIAELKPSELTLPPNNYYEMSGMADFSEWSLLNRWVRQWLHYLHWYCAVALDPWVSIETLLETAPIVTSHWNRKQEDEYLLRFGRLWKCFDMATSLGLDYYPGALPESTGGFPDWILGGHDASFMVFAGGLEQPAAKRGVVKHLGAYPHKTLGVSERQSYIAFQRCVGGKLYFI